MPYVEIEHFGRMAEVAYVNGGEGGQIVGFFTAAEYGPGYVKKARGFAAYFAAKHGPLAVRVEGEERPRKRRPRSSARIELKKEVANVVLSG